MSETFIFSDLEYVVFSCIHQHQTQYHIMIVIYKTQGFHQLLPALEPLFHIPLQSVQIV